MSNATLIYRLHLSNHLGSSNLDLDVTASLISYEEYYPFGSTSYSSGRNAAETSLKRYRYVGKERDDETGLYYYGARYYYSWLCRFVSVDPLKDEYPHYTPYQYAGNKPIIASDLDGKEEDPQVKNPPQGQGYKEGEKITEAKTFTSSDTFNPGLKRSTTITKELYYHMGSERDGEVFKEGFYEASDYRQILIGSSDNAEKVIPLNVETILKDVLGSKETITEKDLSLD